MSRLAQNSKTQIIVQNTHGSNPTSIWGLRKLLHGSTSNPHEPLNTMSMSVSSYDLLPSVLLVEIRDNM